MLEFQNQNQLALYILVTSSLDENKKFRKETAILKNESAELF